jgi:hypothetical protein
MVRKRPEDVVFQQVLVGQHLIAARPREGGGPCRYRLVKEPVPSKASTISS